MARPSDDVEERKPHPRARPNQPAKTEVQKVCVGDLILAEFLDTPAPVMYLVLERSSNDPHEWLVVEISGDKGGCIRQLAKLSQPDVARQLNTNRITRIGPARISVYTPG